MATEGAEATLVMAAPEVGVPLIAAQTVAEHGKPIFGGMLIAVSIVFIIIAIIIVSAAKSKGAKTAGWLMLGLFFLVGGYGGFLVARRNKDKRA